MTTVKDLIDSLQDRNPEAQVFFMTQRKHPFENHIAGLVGREEMTDQRDRIEPGVRTDDVFLVVGKRIRPGSLSAWLIAEHGTGQPRESAPTEAPEAASQAPETAFGEAPATAPTEFSVRAPEAAQIASTEASASALGAPVEVFPIAPEPAETAPGAAEND